MSFEPIYSGWNTRDKLKSAVKRSIANLGRSSEARALTKLAEQVCAELSKHQLDNEQGRMLLAEQMATRILEQLREGSARHNEIGDLDVTVLPFHQHLSKFCLSLIEYEALFEPPAELFDLSNAPNGWLASSSLTRSQLWEIEDKLKKIKAILNDFDGVMNNLTLMVHNMVEPITTSCPTLLEQGSNTSGLSFTAPLSLSVNELPELIERLVQLPFAPEFDEIETTANLRERVEYNVIIASGGSPTDPQAFTRQLRMPTKQQTMPPNALIKTYLEGSPLEALFNFCVPITLPQETRFEHHHIVAGSGHGKTQTLQHLILNDLHEVARGGASLVVLDSQGDLINNIRSLQLFAPDHPLSNKLIVIDPTDVEYPVSLNLFDVNMERINQYSQLDRERMTNGILELYDFVLGSLLSAEMTQKQSVIFRYITRLLLLIPNATIHTLRELLEEGGADKYRQYINSLEGTAKAFFQSEFDSREFTQTKRQVVRRLWGILENQTFERMFSHPRNKLDLFTEMNKGKVILINTAKDLLKENGTQIFGRFFIAMIAQAAQERSVIDKDKRMPTYVYIDEAQDYFDHNINIILSQARKFKVGMVMANQFLGQLDNKLQEAVFANTSIKFAGGVSAKDARALANEMRTDPASIENQDKLSFAAFIRGTTKQAVSLSITAGQMERLPKMSEADLTAQRDMMRKRYAQHFSEAGMERADDWEEDLDEAVDGADQEPMEWD